MQNISPHHNTQRVEPTKATPKPTTAMPKWTSAKPPQASVKTADRALPGNLTKRLITGEIERYKPTAAFAQLSRTINWRVEFHSDIDGHARLEVGDDLKLDQDLIETMVGWAVGFRDIGEYDAIFALLDCLDLSMVVEFSDLAEGG